MGLDRCITDLSQKGELPPEVAKEMRDLYDEIRNDLAGSLGENAADAVASTRTLDQMEAARARKRFLAGRKIMAQRQLEADLKIEPGKAISADHAIGLFIDRQSVDHFNVDGRRQAIQRRAFGMIGDILERHHTNIAGQVRNTAELRDVVRAVFGEKVDSVAAREMADAWTQASEMLRQRFNAAGGDVGKLRTGKGYIPQGHDWLKVREAGFDTWRETILPLLDRDAMIDERTGLPLSGARLNEALRSAFDTIRTDGWSSREAGGVGMGRGVANRRADPRFLIFKDADSWLAYNELFGRGTPYGAMTGYIKGMAKDIAAMERFGPNPEAGVKWVRDSVEKAAMLVYDNGKAVKRANSTLNTLSDLWAEYTGANQKPAVEWLANVGKAVRSYATAKSLGSATLSAVPGDISTQFNWAQHNDLPFMKIMSQQMKLLNPANAEHRRLAQRMGLIYEGWVNDAAGRMRALNDELAAGVTGRLAEGVLRASGLTAWTDSGQSAFGMAVLGHMADMKGRAFDKLDSGFREMLSRGGIDETGWDAIRSTTIRNESGGNWIFAQDVADTALGDKMLAMIAKEQKFAVQQADMETRALMHANMKKGTWTGEFLQSSLLFKSFGISMLFTHGRQILNAANWRQRAVYLARFAIATTLAGAVAVQLREIAKGRDPQPMDNKNFWFTAAMQGGGFGMIGDLLNTVVEPRMSSWAKWFAGPVVDMADDFTKLISTAGQHIAYGQGWVKKDANVGGAAHKVLTQQLPGGNLWYARLALQRIYADELQEAIDPHYKQSWKMMLTRAHDQGTDYWWAPGEQAPERAPQLDNALKPSPQQ